MVKTYILKGKAWNKMFLDDLNSKTASLLEGKRVKNAFYAKNAHNSFKSNLYLSIGNVLVLELDNDTSIELTSLTSGRKMGLQIKKREDTYLHNSQDYQLLHTVPVWSKYSGKTITDIQYFYKDVKKHQAKSYSNKTKKTPIALQLSFDGVYKMWIVCADIQLASNPYLSLKNMMLFFNYETVNDSGIFPLKQLDKNPALIDEKPLYEKFTFKGFLMVSLLAFMYIIPIFSIIFIEGVLEQYSSFQKFLILYAIVWFLIFLFFCLIPKLNSLKN